MIVKEGCKYERKCGKKYALVTRVRKRDGRPERVYYERIRKNTGSRSRNHSLNIDKFKRYYPTPMNGYYESKSELKI